MKQSAIIRSDHSGTLNRVFRISLWLKGIDGAFELLGGILFLFVKPSTIGATVRFLTRHEIAEDPHDLVANFLRHTAEQLSVNKELLASVYLLGHGLIKIVLVYGLLTGRKGIYPYAFLFLGLFIAIETARLIEFFSFGILILMLFDLFVLTMVWLEYRKLQ